MRRENENKEVSKQTVPSFMNLEKNRVFLQNP